MRVLGRHSRKQWERFVRSESQHLASPEALDFRDALQCDHQSRQEKPWSGHPYVNAVTKGRAQMGSSRRQDACQQPRYVRDLLRGSPSPLGPLAGPPVIAAANLFGVPVPRALSKNARFCLLSPRRGGGVHSPLDAACTWRGEVK